MCSVKKGILKNFSRFLGKHLSLEFLFNSYSSKVFLWESLRTPTLKNIFERLLLKIMFIWIQLYNNWDNLLEQFPHISQANNFLTYFKRKRIWAGLFSSPRTPGLWISRLFFSFLWYYELSLLKRLK